MLRNRKVKAVVAASQTITVPASSIDTTCDPEQQAAREARRRTKVREGFR